MSTVRVYKVAELLDITSNDVLALLKKNHGIELKSASSTLEEIVARQFVERLAKQKGITLPKGDMFSEQAVQAGQDRREGEGRARQEGRSCARARAAEAGRADARSAAPDQEGEAGRAEARRGGRAAGRGARAAGRSSSAAC